MSMLKLVRILILFSITPLAAQRVEISPIPFDEELIGVLGMAQDKYGYVWIVDNGNGLFKYSGRVEKVYTPQEGNPNAIASGRIENILIAQDGVIWLPTFDQGLDRFDPEEEIFTHFKHNASVSTSIRSNGVRDVVEDSDGNLWVGTNRGLDKYDKELNIFIHHHSDDPDAQNLDKEQIRDLFIDRAGILWIGTGSTFDTEESVGGLYSLDTETKEVRHFLPSEKDNSLIDSRVRVLFEDSKGNFWVGTGGDGLHIMNRQDGTFERHTYDPQNPKKLSRPPLNNTFSFGDDHITFIEEDDQNGIWIGTFENGINHYDPNTGVTRHYGSTELGPYQLAIDYHWRSLKTKDGLLWFASWNPGSSREYILRANTTPHQVLLQEQETVSSFYQTSEGDLYQGTQHGLQVKHPDGKITICFNTHAVKTGVNVPVTDITADQKGRLWAPTRGAGLYCFDPKTKRIDSFRHEQNDASTILSDHLGSVELLADGQLLIATDQGINILDPEQRSFKAYPLAGETDNNFYISGPTAILDDSLIWFGTRHGIYIVARNGGDFRKYELGLGQEIVDCLIKDHADQIYIGTVNHGLRRYDEQLDIFTPMLYPSGHLSKYLNVHAIIEDHEHYLWVASGSGIIRIDPERKSEHRFSEHWGFISEYRTNFYQAPEGEDLFLGSLSGYYRFNPKQLRGEGSSPQPFVTGIQLGREGEKYELDKRELTLDDPSIELDYHQNDITFEIGYIDYLNPNPRIEYQLLNYDQGYRIAESGDQISYYKVPPGRYTLELRAVDIYGNWGEKRIPVFIKPPWYKTWWAYLGYGICFLSLAYIIDGIQRKRLLTKERERTRDRELAQAREIEKAYRDLKATQTQLIHAEKMASLGELTAGIAHEIQNPLNFVNNFAEVSTELLDEMNEEITNADFDEVKTISISLKQNLEKINHHGKRADSIVKGMLQHSRQNSDERTATDISQLAEEYLRLSYHGLRATNKSFNATFTIDAEVDLPKIEIVSQDMGRALLNLFTNAFHTVSEKATILNGKVYEPTVKVKIERIENQIEIRVIDNGNGISKEIIQKIFQPFFTTKSTGQGTGLGLSLTYDIVTAHGGEIMVDSTEGEGTTFKIVLPINQADPI